MSRTLRPLLVLVALIVGGIAAFVLSTWASWARWMRQAGLPAPARTVFGWIRVLVDDFVAVLQIVAWHVTLPWSRRLWVPPTPRDVPVLCVHGLSQDGTNFLAIRRALYARGRTTLAVTVAPPWREFASYVRNLERHLERLLADTGAARVDVVCHSMGGLMLRALLDRRPALRARIGRVVTLATPHRGTGAARGLAVHVPEVRVALLDSPWHDATPRLVDLLPGHPVTAIGSLDDHTVYPIDSALADGDQQVCLTGLGHTGVLTDWRSIAHVVAALDRPMARPPESP